MTETVFRNTFRACNDRGNPLKGVPVLRLLQREKRETEAWSPPMTAPIDRSRWTMAGAEAEIRKQKELSA